MEPFRSILVDVDATATAHPALERALLLARGTGARLTITDVMTVPPHARHYLPAAVEETMVGDRRQMLARVARGQAESKFLVGRPATVLIEEVLRSGHDLLMRSHARDLTAAGPKPFGAVDMELLRKCPCPVLLARHGKPAPQPHIACAVNASTEETEEVALNVKLVELALLIAKHLQSGSITLLHAWAPFAERAVRSHSADDQFASYLEGARQRATADLARLVQSFGERLADAHSMVRRGEPEDVIPEFVVAEGIDLLVMGTVARSGIPGLFIGNTAERVLRKLPCSVLAVKPDGFVSPVRPSTS
jgi:nucleotide-binding universal stress UspA family protein